MAEASEMTKAAFLVSNVGLVVSDLPRVADEWATWPEDWQADYTLEWMGLMTNLAYVARLVASGQARHEEAVAYARLQENLRAVAPLLERLDLEVPAELLRVPPRASEVA